MKKVDFVIAGAQKSGTTALDLCLRQHPEICMANKKEVHFFDNDALFQNTPNYDKYHSFFDCDSNAKMVGETTPIYLYWKDAPRRMFEYNQNLKIIVVLRNPIERAYSHWNMEKNRGADKMGFSDALMYEALRCAEALPNQHRVFSYIDRGYYTVQMLRMQKFFSKELIMPIKYESLITYPALVLNSICDFLHINRYDQLILQKSHQGIYDSNIFHKEKTFLKNKFENDVKQLEGLLDWSCKDWLKF